MGSVAVLAGFLATLALCHQSVFSASVSSSSSSASSSSSGPYLPNWASIDSRPLPSWYDESKLGIFVHWGVFSVPSFESDWFWKRWKTHDARVTEFMKKNYKPDFTYADFAKDFTAEFFEPDEWAQLFQDSGAKYIVFVSKHHEGFTNWPSKYSFNWNSMDVGPKRDIVGELATAIKKKKMIFGLYHSLFEGYNPLFLQDKANNFTTQDYVFRKSMPELYEIVNKYEPEVIWSDGDGHAPDVYWNSTKFLAWLYNDSPVKDTVVTNDRWGNNGLKCKHGGFLTCHDRYNPGVLQPRKWENAMTIDSRSWGFRRNANIEDYLTMDQLIHTFIITVSCGGNMLMNVGPTKYGVIAPIFQDRLRSMGQWLKVNGEGIYSSRPWTFQNDTTNANVWYTMKESGSTKDVYAFVLSWPEENTLSLGAPAAGATTVVTLLGYSGGTFDYTASGARGLEVKVPPINFASMPCQWAWVFKLTNVTN